MSRRFTFRDTDRELAEQQAAELEEDDVDDHGDGTDKNNSNNKGSTEMAHDRRRKPRSSRALRHVEPNDADDVDAAALDDARAEERRLRELLKTFEIDECDGGAGAEAFPHPDDSDSTMLLGGSASHYPSDELDAHNHHRKQRAALELDIMEDEEAEEDCYEDGAFAASCSAAAAAAASSRDFECEEDEEGEEERQIALAKSSSNSRRSCRVLMRRPKPDASAADAARGSSSTSSSKQRSAPASISTCAVAEPRAQQSTVEGATKQQQQLPAPQRTPQPPAKSSAAHSQQMKQQQVRPVENANARRASMNSRPQQQRPQQQQPSQSIVQKSIASGAMKSSTSGSNLPDPQNGAATAGGAGTDGGEKKKKKKPRVPVAHVAFTKYPVVKRSLTDLGYRLLVDDGLPDSDEQYEPQLNDNGEPLPPQKAYEDMSKFNFNVVWSDTVLPVDKLSRLESWQRSNHYPGMSVITRKIYLAHTMSAIKKSPAGHYFSFVPATFALRSERTLFQRFFSSIGSSKSGKFFILKPNAGAQGKGIVLSRDPLNAVDFPEDYICQEYVARPLLIEGKKFDLRVYVLVTSVKYLTVRVFDEGLVRMCVENYVKPTNANAENTCVHLTNYAVNKKSAQFVKCVDAEGKGDTGSKRDFAFFSKFLAEQKDSGGAPVDAKAVWASVHELVVRTVLAAQPKVQRTYSTCFPLDSDGRRCFEILGFDVLIDDQFQPWLMEVNHTPSFATDSPLDTRIKHALLKEALEIVAVQQKPARRKAVGVAVERLTRGGGAAARGVKSGGNNLFLANNINSNNNSNNKASDSSATASTTTTSSPVMMVKTTEVFLAAPGAGGAAVSSPTTDPMPGDPQQSATAVTVSSAASPASFALASGPASTFFLGCDNPAQQDAVAAWRQCEDTRATHWQRVYPPVSPTARQLAIYDEIALAARECSSTVMTASQEQRVQEIRTERLRALEKQQNPLIASSSFGAADGGANKRKKGFTPAQQQHLKQQQQASQLQKEIAAGSAKLAPKATPSGQAQTATVAGASAKSFAIVSAQQQQQQQLREGIVATGEGDDVQGKSVVEQQQQQENAGSMATNSSLVPPCSPSAAPAHSRRRPLSGGGPAPRSGQQLVALALAYSSSTINNNNNNNIHTSNNGLNESARNARLSPPSCVTTTAVAPYPLIGQLMKQQALDLNSNDPPVNTAFSVNGQQQALQFGRRATHNNNNNNHHATAAQQPAFGATTATSKLDTQISRHKMRINMGPPKYLRLYLDYQQALLRQSGGVATSSLESGLLLFEQQPSLLVQQVQQQQHQQQQGCILPAAGRALTAELLMQLQQQEQHLKQPFVVVDASRDNARAAGSVPILQVTGLQQQQQLQQGAGQSISGNAAKKQQHQQQQQPPHPVAGMYYSTTMVPANPNKGYVNLHHPHHQQLQPQTQSQGHASAPFPSGSASAAATVVMHSGSLSPAAAAAVATTTASGTTTSVAGHFRFPDCRVPTLSKNPSPTLPLTPATAALPAAAAANKVQSSQQQTQSEDLQQQQQQQQQQHQDYATIIASTTVYCGKPLQWLAQRKASTSTTSVPTGGGK